jgi:hypothetical protein
MTLADTNNDKGHLAFLALQALETHMAAQGLKFDSDSSDIIHEALWDALGATEVVAA